MADGEACSGASSDASAQTEAGALTPRSTASSKSLDHWEATGGLNSLPKRSRLNTEQEDLLRGLAASPKTIPCSFLYDAAGSALYDRITELEEYYPYRAEVALLEAHGGEVISALAPGAVLVELGCGSATKTGILLREALARLGPEQTRFVGIDISAQFLRSARANLLAACPGLKASHVETVCAPYLEGLAEARRRHPKATLCVLWLGSSVGNLEPDQAEAFFRSILELCGPRTQVFFCADQWKDAAQLHAAYCDAGGVTEAFIRNGLAHALRQLPGHRGGGGPSAWRYEVDVNPELQQVEMWLRATRAQQLGEGVAVAAGERVLIEVSRKFTPARMRRLAFRGGFCTQAAWRGPLYAMQLVAAPLLALEAGWRDTDAFFAFPQGVGSWGGHPIDLRHPFCFYYGHIAAFAKLKLLPGEPQSDWDVTFCRGMDPDVADPSQCHDHPPPPPQWPSRGELEAYVAEVRGALRAAALRGRLPHRTLVLALEHERLHLETLDYMLAQARKQRFTAKQAQAILQRLEAAGQQPPPAPCERVCIPVATVALGTDLAPEDGFAWDNELPQQAPVEVASFEVDARPVTVAQFRRWAVEARGYQRPEWWPPGGHALFQELAQCLPATWSLEQGGEVFVHLPHGSFHWRELADEPVYCSATEAAAYCAAQGAGLLTEAQWHSALAHDPQGERVAALESGGWEHTATDFAPLEGFAADPAYPEYSQDFFDGKHSVLLGASPSTHPSVRRPGFRNFYQRAYPYVFAKFRCARPGRGE